MKYISIKYIFLIFNQQMEKMIKNFWTKIQDNCMLSACIVSGIVGVGFGIAIFMTYLSNETTAVSSARLFDISFGSVILGAAMFGITLIGTASMFEKKAD